MGNAGTAVVGQDQQVVVLEQTANVEPDPLAHDTRASDIDGAQAAPLLDERLDDRLEQVELSWWQSAVNCGQLGPPQGAEGALCFIVQCELGILDRASDATEDIGRAAAGLRNLAADGEETQIGAEGDPGPGDAFLKAGQGVFAVRNGKGKAWCGAAMAS